VRILFVQPEYRSAQIGFHLVALAEPLALELLAAMVPDHEVAILDMRIDPDLPAVLERFAPDVVAVTALTNEVYAAQAVLAAAKACSPEIFTIMGGHHATLVPEDFHLPFVDAICLGEGESVFPPLVAALAARKPLESVPNLVWRDGDGHFVSNARAVALINLDSVPLPRRDLVQKYRPEYFWLFAKPDSCVATGHGSNA
jgi:hopanoid C-3 methylase